MQTSTQAEKHLYETMHTNPSFALKGSPSKAATRAYIGLSMQEGDSLTDFGSGSGKAVLQFQALGLEARGIDIAANANVSDIPFFQACLWDLGDFTHRDWGYCNDVMQHIPTSKVDEVLSNIATLSKFGAWFVISTRKDVIGPRFVSRQLHQTVRESIWWRGQLLKHFEDVETIEDTGREVTLRCLHGFEG